MSEIVIAVRRDDIAAYGLAPAVVLQQIRWVTEWEEIHRGGDGWYEGSSGDLAALCGLTGKQVRTATSHLIDAGAVERERQVTSKGEGKPRYRPVPNPAESAGAQTVTPGAQTGSPEGAQTGSPTSVRKGFKESPPTPPTGGQQRLGAVDDDPETQTSKRKRRDTASENDLVTGWVRSMFEHWPGTTSNRGKPDAARRAMAKALAAGWTPSEIQARMESWLLARRRYLEATGAEAPVMHVSRFINELVKEREVLADGENGLWTSEDYDLEWLAGRWPCPPGQSWDGIRGRSDRQGSGRRLSMAELLELERAGELEADHG